MLHFIARYLNILDQSEMYFPLEYLLYMIIASHNRLQ